MNIKMISYITTFINILMTQTLSNFYKNNPIKNYDTILKAWEEGVWECVCVCVCVCVEWFKRWICIFQKRNRLEKYLKLKNYN